MDREWVVDLVERLPQGALSRAWGVIARCRRPRFAIELLKRAFVAGAAIDMSEARDPLSAYATLQELFNRSLRAGARRIDPEPAALVSPADGTVGPGGEIRDGTLLQVKGRSYTLARLLDDAAEAQRFEGGSYLTIYLSPSDYHRVHAPVSGQVAEATVIPGALMPVFEESLRAVAEVFARNERLVTYIDAPEAGRVAVVKVGATLVGHISVTYDPEIHTNARAQARRQQAYDPPRPLQKGAELGAFEMGSTVVVAVEPGRVLLEPSEPGDRVRVGQRIGTVVGRGSQVDASRRRPAGAKPRGKRRMRAKS